MNGKEKIKASQRLEAVKDFLHSVRALRLLICILGTLILAAIFEVAIVPVRYDLRVGMVPTHTISATKDVVDEISTEKQRSAAAAAVMPTYRYQQGVTEQVLSDLDKIFAQLRAVRQYGATLPDQAPNRVFSSEELQYARDMLNAVSFRDYQLSALLRSSQEELEDAYTLLYSAVQSIMQGRVIEGQQANAVASIRQIVDFRISIPLGQNVVPAVLNTCIQPNMLIDQEATDKAREAARNAVEPVVYKQGQNIVVRGEGRITSNQLAMLSTLGLLSSGDVDVTMYLGALLLITIVLGSMLFQLRRPYYHLFDNTRRLLLLFIILVVTLGLSVLARLIHIYLAPTLLGILLITALLGMRPAIICNAALTVLVAALAAGSSEAYTETMVMLITTGMLSGTVAGLLLNNRVTRLRVLFSGLAASGVDFAVFLSLGLMTNSDLTGILTDAFIRVGGTLISTLLCIGLQPLLESIFNLATPMKLMELSNPNQPLLRRLLLEAPGTYHHSTIVSNLSEAAAEAVGANPLLARVGALYHDVGKLKRPLYFKENQLGDRNVHDYTDPLVSAAIVTSHTQDGVTLAKQYRLPQEVLSIIGEHHGNTPVMFFYHKALQQAGGKPVDINTFRYSGRPPKTKEGAVVLICDTIEAAVRTLKNPTPEAIENFILKLVRGKLEDGQLSDSPLTLQDIDKICVAATTVLSGVFHERIEYPDAEEIKKKEEALKEKEPAPQEKQEPAAKEAEEQPVVVTPPAAEPVPVVEVTAQMPLKVVTPQATAELVAVTPPPAIEPVAVEKLVKAEQMPLQEAEETPKEEEKA